MRRARHNQAIGSLSELNVTPLLDLAFVLLIIFMITAPFLAESASLTIPTSKASNEAVDPSKVFTISVDKFRAVEVDGNRVEPAALEAEIRRLKGLHPEMAAIIKAHNTLPVQDLVGVMDALRSAGVAKVGVVTKPAGDGAP